MTIDKLKDIFLISLKRMKKIFCILFIFLFYSCGGGGGEGGPSPYVPISDPVEECLNVPNPSSLIPQSPILVNENTSLIPELMLGTGCFPTVIFYQADPVNDDGIPPGYLSDLSNHDITFGVSGNNVINTDTRIGNSSQVTKLLGNIQIGNSSTLTIAGDLNCDNKLIETYNGILLAEKVKLRNCHIRGGSSLTSTVGKIELKGVSFIGGSLAAPSGSAINTQYIIENSYFKDIDKDPTLESPEFFYIWYPKEIGLRVKNSVFFNTGPFDIAFSSNQISSSLLIENNVFASSNDNLANYVDLWASYKSTSQSYDLILNNNAFLKPQYAFSQSFQDNDGNLISNSNYFGVTSNSEVSSRYFDSSYNLSYKNPIINSTKFLHGSVSTAPKFYMPIKRTSNSGEISFEYPPDFELGINVYNYLIKIIDKNGTSHSLNLQINVLDVQD